MRTLVLVLSFVLAAAAAAQADTLVAGEAIATRIADAIQAKLPTSGRYRVTLADGAYQLTLPASAQGRYEIAALTYDPARKTFAATLSYVAEAGAPEYVRLAGSALPVIDVPALNHDMRAGEAIAEADLTTIEFDAARASSTLLTSAEALVGQIARRQLRANTPLFVYDVKKSVLVKKGDLVTVTYALPGIELTAQGQAQADAGQGDTVAILNTRSRRTIEGRVTGAGTVTVTAPGAARVAAQ